MLSLLVVDVLWVVVSVVVGICVVLPVMDVSELPVEVWLVMIVPVVVRPGKRMQRVNVTKRVSKYHHGSFGKNNLLT